MIRILGICYPGIFLIGILVSPETPFIVAFKANQELIVNEVVVTGEQAKQATVQRAFLRIIIKYAVTLLFACVIPVHITAIDAEIESFQAILCVNV